MHKILNESKSVLEPLIEFDVRLVGFICLVSHVQTRINLVWSFCFLTTRWLSSSITRGRHQPLTFNRRGRCCVTLYNKPKTTEPTNEVLSPNRKILRAWSSWIQSVLMKHNRTYVMACDIKKNRTKNLPDFNGFCDAEIWSSWYWRKSYKGTLHPSLTSGV